MIKYTFDHIYVQIKTKYIARLGCSLDAVDCAHLICTHHITYIIGDSGSVVNQRRKISKSFLSLTDVGMQRMPLARVCTCI